MTCFSGLPLAGADKFSQRLNKLHDMQEYFITAYDRNVNPTGTALSNIRSIISFADLRGMERNTAEVLSA